MNTQQLRLFSAGYLVFLGTAAGCAGDRAARFEPSPEQAIRVVADRVLADFPTPPPFDWGEGVLMAGMMRAGKAVNEPRYSEFVRRWADHWKTSGLGPVLEGTKAPDKGYCGRWGPGFPVMMLHESTREAAYLDMGRQIAEFIMTRATRTGDGALGHWMDNYQLWVDTLYMVCPLFAELSRQTGDVKYIEEAARQLDLFALHCQDRKTGLFYHMYDEKSGKQMGTLWARGNGWVVMSYIEVLAHLADKSPYEDKLEKAFKRQMCALLKTQDRESHLWHTVLDHPETYLETSASAMILYGMIKGDKLDLYDLKDKDLVRRTWAAVAGKVNADGRVIDVSGGTGPDRLEVYSAKPRGTYTWGTGAFLLAAAALCER